MEVFESTGQRLSLQEGLCGSRDRQCQKLNGP